MTINRRTQGVIAVAAIAAIGVALLFSGAITGQPLRTFTAGSSQPPGETGLATINNTIGTDANASGTVAVGGGNLTVSINQFSPSNVEIQPGESVTFSVPSGSTEIHNVVFDLSGGAAISSIELAFILPSGFSTETLELAPPDNFGEPVIQNLTDGRQAIVGINKVLFHPSYVNQTGHATFLQEHELIQQMQEGAQQGLFMPPLLSANYSMQGNEVVVSSGLMLDVMGFAPLQQQLQVGPEGQQQEPTQQEIEGSLPPAYPILSNFTVTFSEPGVYPFFCAFHPGMAGVVNVIDPSVT